MMVFEGGYRNAETGKWQGENGIGCGKETGAGERIVAKSRSINV